MNTENEIIRINKNTCSLSQMQNIEADFVLPDYFADISKILKCTVIPFTEVVSVSGDKISVAGKIQLSLLYSGEDKRLYNFENEVKYTKVFQGQNVSIEDSITASQYVTSVNYRALGPKRIELKGSVQISLDISSVKEQSFVSLVEGENIFLKNDKTKILMPVTRAQRDFVLTANMVPEGIDKSGIQCIIRKSSKINYDEIKPISDKLFIKGEGIITVYYLTNERRISKAAINIPFSEVLDLYQVKENDMCIIESTDMISNVLLKDDEDKYSFDVSVNVSATIKVMREKEICYIKDIYSSSENLDTEFDEFAVCSKFDRRGKTFTGECEFDLYDIQGEIIDCYIDGIHITQEKNEKNTLIIISGIYNALIRQDDYSMYLISRTFSDEYTNDSVTENFAEKVTAQNYDVLSVSALQKGAEKIVFKSDIFVEFAIDEECKVKMLTDVDKNKNEVNEIKNRIILYYARKNEEIWNIAKENNASITRIKDINGLDSEVLKEDKVLLLTNF